MPKPEVTYETLRLIAESASGMRDLPTWFIIEETPQGTGYRWQHTFVRECEDTVVIYCAPVADLVSQVDHATIGVGNTTANLMKVQVKRDFPHEEMGTFKADAAFWSLAAVEKFLVPYYASVYGDEGPAHAQAVMDLMRIPDTHLGADVDTEEGQVYALVHLPSSEYVPMEVPHVAALRTNGRHTFVRHAGADQGFSARTNGSREMYAFSSGR